MPKCSFCQSNYPVHQGMTYVEISGRILHFCKSKCINNWKLGRDAKRCKWVTKQADVQAATKKANIETASRTNVTKTKF